MANAITLERYRRQFDACLGPVPGRKPKPITGIERMALEEQSEREEAKEMYRELADSFRETNRNGMPSD